MKTLYDVQQLLKKFDIYVYVGKRLWDIDGVGVGSPSQSPAD